MARFCRSASASPSRLQGGELILVRLVVTRDQAEELAQGIEVGLHLGSRVAARSPGKHDQYVVRSKNHVARTAVTTLHQVINERLDSRIGCDMTVLFGAEREKGEIW